MKKISSKHWNERLDETNFSSYTLGFIQTRHFGTQISDKKIFLSHGFQALNETLSTLICGSLTAYLSCSIEIKISFYRNMAILCAKMSRVNKALLCREEVINRRNMFSSFQIILEFFDYLKRLDLNLHLLLFTLLGKSNQ